MEDWQYAHKPTALSRSWHSSITSTMIKHQDGRQIPFAVTVKEFAVAPKGQNLRFFAEADKQVNQSSAGFVPSGWGDSVLKALADCMRLIRQFPFEG